MKSHKFPSFFRPYPNLYQTWSLRSAKSFQTSLKLAIPRRTLSFSKNFIVRPTMYEYLSIYLNVRVE